MAHEILTMPESANEQAIIRIAASLEGLEQFPLPMANGMTLVMGLVPDPRDGTRMTVSGCHRSPELALAACAGEAAEFIAQCERPQEACLELDRLPKWNDDKNLRVPIQSKDWMIAKDLSDGGHIAVPGCLARYHPSSAHLDISTGCAAGPTRNDATFHGLREIIERDALSRWRDESIAPYALEPSPRLARWIDSARQNPSARQVALLDIGMDGPLPVVIALSHDADGRNLCTGSCAHPDPEACATGALRELFQMEFGLQLARFKEENLGSTGLSEPDKDLLSNADGLFDRPDQFKPSGQKTRDMDADRLSGGASTQHIAAYFSARGQRCAVADLSASAGLCVVKTFIEGLDTPIRRYS
ncbi:YcaO-like family protein [Roseibium sp.]|uniref:YcaO-like family protein n=1 Tax=Roseibium sp. TaxID=1936156 RepID=UPI003A97BAE0